MISYPGTPGTIELLGLKDSVETIEREYNTLTRYYRYHLSRPVEKIEILLTSIRPVPKEGTMYSFPTKRKKRLHELNKELEFGTSRQL